MVSITGAKQVKQKPTAREAAAALSNLLGPDLAVGDEVEIFGLQGAQELNGRQGTIVKIMEETQRYGIKLPGHEEPKAVKAANLTKLRDGEVDLSQKAALERELNEVVQRLKRTDGTKDAVNIETDVPLQRQLGSLIQRLKRIEEGEADQVAAYEAAMVARTKAAREKAKAPEAAREKPLIVIQKPAPEPLPPLALQFPPPPREQHHPLAQLPPKQPATGGGDSTSAGSASNSASSSTEGGSSSSTAMLPIFGGLQPRSTAAAAGGSAAGASSSSSGSKATAVGANAADRMGDALQSFVRHSCAASSKVVALPAAVPLRREAPMPKPLPPPVLPERLKLREPTGPMQYTDENEYPDPALALRSLQVTALAFLFGIVASQVDLFPATWFVWSFLLVHILGTIFLVDYASERGLTALCAVLGLHAGVAASETGLWLLDQDGEDSVGPWSIVVFFSCVMYLHGFWTECLILPPDYITSCSLFFPMYPAFNVSLVVSCMELFAEWWYFEEYKIWKSAALVGCVMMFFGQALIYYSARTAGRNYWASCREMPEEEEKLEDFVGLEVPDRRIVQEGLYRWERHPSYVGALLIGVGSQIALCNPIMLALVSFVLWASLLYVALEEEQELYDEFKGGYANYATLTPCWIPLFNGFLQGAAFTREMADAADEIAATLEDDLANEEDEGYYDDENCESDNELLPSWDGVKKGGAVWNRQFREPWMLG